MDGSSTPSRVFHLNPISFFFSFISILVPRMENLDSLGTISIKMLQNVILQICVVPLAKGSKSRMNSVPVGNLTWTFTAVGVNSILVIAGSAFFMNMEIVT